MKKRKNVKILAKEDMIIREWLKQELERIMNTMPLQSEIIAFIRENVHFITVNGLVARPNQMIGTNWYVVQDLPMSNLESRRVIWIVAAVPLFTYMEARMKDTWSAILQFLVLVCQSIYNSKISPNFQTAEKEAFENLKKLLGSGKIGAEKALKMRVKIENLISMQMTAGMPIEEEPSYIEQIQRSFIIPSHNIKERANKAFSRACSRMTDYEDARIAKDIQIRFVPALLLGRSEATQTTSIAATILGLTPSGVLNFAIMLLSIPLLEAVSDEDIEVIIFHEISHLILKRKYQRGAMEREIGKLLSPKYKEMANRQVERIYGANKLQNVQKRVEQLIGTLLEQNCPIISLQ
ncbi:MAG: hypothetical protein ACFFDT_27490 [Candidatus Hodarchaeota archaeon]